MRRWDQCGVYILYSKISTDPGILKIRHCHRFVAVVIQILIPFVIYRLCLVNYGLSVKFMLFRSNHDVFISNAYEACYIMTPIMASLRPKNH